MGHLILTVVTIGPALDHPAQIAYSHWSCPACGNTQPLRQMCSTSEFTYVSQGVFIVESGLTAEQRTEEGDGHMLPADTPVQMRNPESEQPAAFLFWFVIDPEQSFAPEAHLNQ